ncbi:MAG TPA: hypothetical protein VEC10_01485 [Steroidobacteraceae bacterium]|nr:hypothetical protein [Steroidobacteraceae bacterium]
MRLVTRLLLRLGVGGLSLAATAGAASTPEPWADIAATDLKAIHQLLLDNHPGPVDPQNPRYRLWLEGGFSRALTAAASARNYFDYKRVVLAYLEGFRDGHTNIVPSIDATFYEWPGFLPAVTADGKVRVGVSEERGVAVGEELVSCDGTPIDALFERNVAPYYWNRDIPQDRALNMPRTLLIDAGDEHSRVRACDIAGPAGVRHLELQWRSTTRARGIALRGAADGRVVPQLGLREIGGVWFLSFPSFDYQSGADVERFRAFSRRDRRPHRSAEECQPHRDRRARQPWRRQRLGPHRRRLYLGRGAGAGRQREPAGRRRLARLAGELRAPRRVSQIRRCQRVAGGRHRGNHHGPPADG